MPQYSYICKKCSLEFTRIRPVKDCNDTFPCPECNEPTPRQFVAAISSIWKTDLPTFQNIDMTVGKQAEERWNQIYARQEIKNKIRKENENPRLAKTLDNEYFSVNNSKYIDKRKHVYNEFREGFAEQKDSLLNYEHKKFDEIKGGADVTF